MTIKLIDVNGTVVDEIEVESVSEYEEFVKYEFPQILKEGLSVKVEGSL